MIKTVIVWTLGLSLSFAVFVTAAFYGKTRLQKKKKPGPEVVVPDSTVLARVDSLKLVIRELMGQLEQQVAEKQALEDSLEDREARIADLTARRQAQAAEIDSLKHQIESIRATEIKVQDLTKTLGSMKVDVLRPILANLSNEVIQILYDQARTKEKEKIFNALPPDRASQILKNVTRTLN